MIKQPKLGGIFWLFIELKLIKLATTQHIG
jgi:hypothetical protein